MTLYTHNPSSLGLTNGSTLTNGAVTGVAAGWQQTAATSSGGSITYQSGTWQCIGNSGAARLDGTVAEASEFGIEVLFSVDALPTGSANRGIELLNAASFALRFEQNTNGTWMLLNSANTSVWTSNNVGTGLVRFFIGVTPNTDTPASGSVVVYIYKTDALTSTTPDDSYTSTSFNAGASPIVRSRIGRISSANGSTASLRVVNVQANDASATPIGPLPSNTLPTAIVSSSGPFYRYDALGSLNGSAASLNWSISHASGPNNLAGIIESPEGVFYIPQADSAASYTITVQGDGTDTEVVSVPAITVDNGTTVASGIRRRRWNGTSLVG